MKWVKMCASLGMVDKRCVVTVEDGGGLRMAG